MKRVCIVGHGRIGRALALAKPKPDSVSGRVLVGAADRDFPGLLADAVARVEGRFAYRGANLVIYTIEIEDSQGSRVHELELHPIAPLELEAAVLAAGFAVTRASRVAGRAVIAATAG